jgi:acetyltransferase-like isoleucine patch superfamily enzyme
MRKDSARSQERLTAGKTKTLALQGHGHWAFAMYLLNQRLLSFFSTSVMRIRLMWWRVQGAEQAQFFGLTHICRHPTGAMVLGRHLVFRSAPSSNSVGLKQSCFLSAGRGATLCIGDHCGFSGTVIAASEHIKIGQRVLCGANVTICDSDRHPIAAAQRQLPPAAQQQVIQTAPICIEDDVFIGMNALILKGVTIGAGAVVAANSVVTSSVPAGAMVAGNPAKIIGETTRLPQPSGPDSTPLQHSSTSTDSNSHTSAQGHAQP